MTNAQYSKGGTSDELPNSGEKECLECIYSIMTGYQLEGWGCHLKIKVSDPELFLSKRTAGTKMKTRLRERGSSDYPKGGPV